MFAADTNGFLFTLIYDAKCVTQSEWKPNPDHNNTKEGSQNPKLDYCLFHMLLNRNSIFVFFSLDI